MKHGGKWKINNYYYSVSGSRVSGALHIPAPAALAVTQCGKGETGKLRHRIVSKQKLMLQQNFSILTAQGPWQAAWVSQAVSAAMQEAQGQGNAVWGWCFGRCVFLAGM